MTRAHVAIVLAAGGSRRLGRAKQLLTRDGETLVHRAVRLAVGTTPHRTLVVVGAQRAAIVAAVAGVACDCVDNPAWERGLAGSLQAASRALVAHAGPVLVLGCDQPALESAHLDALLSGAHPSTSGCAATLHGDGPGIPAVVPRAWLDDVPVGGDRGFGQRLRALPRDALFLLDAPELRYDLDSEAELAAAIERGWVDASCASSG